MNASKPTSSPPWHMWLVGGLLLLWNGLGAFDYVATIVRFEPYLAHFPEEALAYYFAAPLWVYAMWGIASLGGFLCAVLLLLRRAIAIPVFGVAWLCSLAAGFYGVTNPPPGGYNIIFMVVVLVIALGVLLYMRWLGRRGVLV